MNQEILYDSNIMLGFILVGVLIKLVLDYGRLLLIGSVI